MSLRNTIGEQSGRVALLIMGVALATRVIVFFGGGFYSAPFSDDEAKYVGMTESLLEEGTFSMRPGGRPTSWSGPGFPALLLPAAAIATTNPVEAMRLENLGFGGLLALLTFLVGRRLFDDIVATGAGLIVAVYPMLVYWNMFLLTETAYAVGLLTVVLAMAWAAEKPKIRNIIVVGGVLGAVSLIRPIGLLLSPLLALWVMIVSGGGLRRRLFAATLAISAMALVLLPWSLRNLRVQGVLVPVSTNGGVNLLQGNNPIVWNDPHLKGRFLFYKNPRLKKFFPEAWENGLSETALDEAARRRARAFILKNKGQFIIQAFFKVKSLYRVTILGSGAITKTVCWMTYGVLLPFFALGLVLGLRKWRKLAPLYMMVVAVTLGAMIFYGSPRIRIPIEPIIILFATWGAAELVRGLRKRRLEKPHPLR